MHCSWCKGLDVVNYANVLWTGAGRRRRSKGSKFSAPDLFEELSNFEQSPDMPLFGIGAAAVASIVTWLW